MWRTIKIWLLIRLIQEVTQKCIYDDNKEMFVRAASQGHYIYAKKKSLIKNASRSVLLLRFFPVFCRKPFRKWETERPSKSESDEDWFELDSLIEGARKRGYIEHLQPTQINDIRTSPEGDDFATYFALLQELLFKYWLAWTIIVVPVVGALYSGTFGLKILLLWLLERLPF